MNFIKQCSGVIFLLFLLQACTTIKTFPNVARAGDTISLAVGSADGMTKDAANTTAVYNVDAGGSYPLVVRSVFNLYPDKKSSLYTAATDTLFIIDTSYHEAWQTVMVIDLPPDLPAGTGNIQITSVATYPTISSHINNMPIAMEIISGIGTANTFDHEFGVGSSRTGNLPLLETLPYAQVTPPIDGNYYGAIEMRITLPTSAKNPLEDYQLRVVLDDMRPRTLSNRNIIWGTNNGDLVVMLMSTNGALSSMEARFAIVLEPRFKFTSVPVITELKYYDYYGVLVPGYLPTDFSIVLK